MLISGDKTLTAVPQPSHFVAEASLWIHATSSPKIGYGHLRRSITLALALRRLAKPLFLLDPEDQWSIVQLENQGFNSFGQGFDNAWSVLPEPAAILLDTRSSSGLGSLIGQARRRGIPVISIHDLGLNPLPSDVIIDGSIAPMCRDSSQSQAAYFCGTEYMILDPVYRVLHRQNKTIRNEVRSIWVNLGGGDSRDFYLRVLNGIKCWAHEVEVIGVPGFVSWGQEGLAKNDWCPMQFRWENRNIETYLAQADLAITAGGIAAYEALCAGVPLLALSYDALQQRTITLLARLKACLDLGAGNKLEADSLCEKLSFLESDTEKRRTLSKRGKEIVDGLGSERVIAIIRPLIERRLQPGNESGRDN